MGADSLAESSAKPKVPSRSRRQRILRRVRARRGAAPLAPGPAAAGAALRRRRGCLSSPEARARAQLTALQKGGAPPPGPCGARRGRHAESAPRMLTRSGFAQNAAKTFSSSTARVGAGGASPLPLPATAWSAHGNPAPCSSWQHPGSSGGQPWAGTGARWPWPGESPRCLSAPVTLALLSLTR